MRYYKYIIIILTFAILFFLTSCGGYKIEGLKYDKIEAHHNLYDENISSYILIKSQPDLDSKNMVYNITFYSDFLRGTGRYYHYYQVDYKDSENTIHQYYHVFDYSETERKYAQKFAPHEIIDGINEIDCAIEYEYKLDDINPITNVLKYHEDIIKYNKSDFNELCDSDLFNVSLDKIEKENKYKFTISVEENLFSGHFDFQAFALTKDGSVFPFYGIYHYEVQRGDYLTLSYEEIDKKIEVVSFYYILNYYYDDINEISDKIIGNIIN